MILELMIIFVAIQIEELYVIYENFYVLRGVYDDDMFSLSQIFYIYVIISHFMKLSHCISAS